MNDTLTLNKLEKLIEVESKLRGEYQLQLDAKDATITQLKNDKAALESKLSELENTIATQLGDDDIRSTNFASNGAKIEPAPRIYPGSHHMCITNEDLDQGRGNGLFARA